MVIMRELEQKPSYRCVAHMYPSQHVLTIPTRRIVEILENTIRSGLFLGTGSAIST